MSGLLAYWAAHGTKILGAVVAILAALMAVPGLIPADWNPLMDGLIALLGGGTVKRGFTNSATPPPSP